MYDAELEQSKFWKGAHWLRLDRIRIHEDKKRYRLQSDIDYWKAQFARNDSLINGFLPIVEDSVDNFRDLTDPFPDDGQIHATNYCLPIVCIDEESFINARKDRQPKYHPRPCLEVQEKDLVCLDGQCRIEARDPSSLKWGLVYVILGEIAKNKRDDLIRGYKLYHNNGGKWSYLRLYRAIRNSPTKEVIKQRWRQHGVSLYSNYQALVGCPQAGSAFDLIATRAPHMPCENVGGTFKGSIAIECHEALANYWGNYVFKWWDDVIERTNHVLPHEKHIQLRSINSETFSNLHALVPKMSEKDRAKCDEDFAHGRILRGFHEQVRCEFKKALMASNSMVPSLTLYSKQKTYLQNWSKWISKLLDRGSSRWDKRTIDQILEALYADRTETNITSYEIQTSPTSWRTVSASLCQRRELSRRQLWLFVIRQDDGPSNETDIQRLASLAKRLGYTSAKEPDYSRSIEEEAAKYDSTARIHSTDSQGLVTAASIGGIKSPEGKGKLAEAPLTHRLGHRDNKRERVSQSQHARQSLFFDMAELLPSEGKCEYVDWLMVLACMYRAFIADPLQASEFASLEGIRDTFEYEPTSASVHDPSSPTQPTRSVSIPTLETNSRSESASDIASIPEPLSHDTHEYYVEDTESQRAGEANSPADVQSAVCPDLIADDGVHEENSNPLDIRSKSTSSNPLEYNPRIHNDAEDSLLDDDLAVPIGQHHPIGETTGLMPSPCIGSHNGPGNATEPRMADGDKERAESIIDQDERQGNQDKDAVAEAFIPHPNDGVPAPENHEIPRSDPTRPALLERKPMSEQKIESAEASPTEDLRREFQENTAHDDPHRDTSNQSTGITSPKDTSHDALAEDQEALLSPAMNEEADGANPDAMGSGSTKHFEDTNKLLDTPLGTDDEEWPMKQSQETKRSKDTYTASPAAESPTPCKPAARDSTRSIGTQTEPLSQGNAGDRDAHYEPRPVPKAKAMPQSHVAPRRFNAPPQPSCETDEESLCGQESSPIDGAELPRAAPAPQEPGNDQQPESSGAISPEEPRPAATPPQSRVSPHRCPSGVDSQSVSNTPRISPQAENSPFPHNCQPMPENAPSMQETNSMNSMAGGSKRKRNPAKTNPLPCKKFIWDWPSMLRSASESIAHCFTPNINQAVPPKRCQCQRCETCRRARASIYSTPLLAGCQCDKCRRTRRAWRLMGQDTRQTETSQPAPSPETLPTDQAVPGSVDQERPQRTVDTEREFEGVETPKPVDVPSSPLRDCTNGFPTSCTERTHFQNNVISTPEVLGADSDAATVYSRDTKPQEWESPDKEPRSPPQHRSAETMASQSCADPLSLVSSSRDMEVDCDGERTHEGYSKHPTQDRHDGMPSPESGYYQTQPLLHPQRTHIPIGATQLSDYDMPDEVVGLEVHRDLQTEKDVSHSSRESGDQAPHSPSRADGTEPMANLAQTDTRELEATDMIVSGKHTATLESEQPIPRAPSVHDSMDESSPEDTHMSDPIQDAGCHATLEINPEYPQTQIAHVQNSLDKVPQEDIQMSHVERSPGEEPVRNMTPKVLESQPPIHLDTATPMPLLKSTNREEGELSGKNHSLGELPPASGNEAAQANQCDISSVSNSGFHTVSSGSMLEVLRSEVKRSERISDTDGRCSLIQTKRKDHSDLPEEGKGSLVKEIAEENIVSLNEQRYMEVKTKITFKRRKLEPEDSYGATMHTPTLAVPEGGIDESNISNRAFTLQDGSFSYDGPDREPQAIPNHRPVSLADDAETDRSVASKASTEEGLPTIGREKGLTPGTEVIDSQGCPDQDGGAPRRRRHTTKPRYPSSRVTNFESVNNNSKRKRDLEDIPPDSRQLIPQRLLLLVELKGPRIVNIREIPHGYKTRQNAKYLPKTDNYYTSNLQLVDSIPQFLRGMANTRFAAEVLVFQRTSHSPEEEEELRRQILEQTDRRIQKWKEDLRLEQGRKRRKWQKRNF